MNQVFDKTAAKKVATSGWPQPSKVSISWVDKPFRSLGHIRIKASYNAADCKIKEEDEGQNDNGSNEFWTNDIIGFGENSHGQTKKMCANGYALPFTMYSANKRLCTTVGTFETLD